MLRPPTGPLSGTLVAARPFLRMAIADKWPGQMSRPLLHEWFLEWERSGSLGEGLFGNESGLSGAGIGRGMGGKGMAAMSRE